MADQEIAVVLRLIAKEFQDELKKSQGLLGEFNSFINSWKTQLAAASTALFTIAKSTANYGEELLNTSQKVGVGVEALAGFQYAAKLANLEQAQLVQGLKFLSQNIVEAAAGVQDGASQFNRLGLSVQTATGQLKPTEQVLLEVADRFAALPDSAAKSELAVKLFGKAGIELIPLLNQGKAGIQALMEEARRLGLVMSEQDVRAANEFNDNVDRLMAKLKGLTLEIGNALIPGLNALAETIVTLSTAGGGEGWLSFLFKAASAHLIVLNAGLKEAIANLAALKDMAALTFEKLGFGTRTGPDAGKTVADIGAAREAAIAKIAAEEQERLLRLARPKLFEATEGAGGTTGRTAVPLPTDDAGNLKALEARKQAALAAVKEEVEIAKAGFETLGILSEQFAVQTNLGEASRIQLKLENKQREIARMGELLLQEKEVEVKFFNERKALGFKNAQEREAVQAQHAAAMAKLDGAIRANQVASQNAVHQADLERMKLTISDQAELGRALIKIYSDQYKEQERIRERDLDAEIATRKGLLEQAQTDLATGSVLAARRGAILDAELAKSVGLSKAHLGTIAGFTHTMYTDSVQTIVASLKELPIATELTEQQLTAIVTQYVAQRERERRRERDDFLAGWMEGLHKYVTDTESMFSLAVDMARQTAQAMNQAFQRFFFDLFEGRIRTFKDALRGVLDFAKQILSQLAAQMATSGLLKLGLSFFTSAAATQYSGPIGPTATGEPLPGSVLAGISRQFYGGPVQRYAIGGPVIPYANGDSVRALLTPGEYVMSRAAVERMGVPNMDRINHGGAAWPGSTPVTVNIHNPGRSEKPEVNVRQSMEGLVVDIMYKMLRTDRQFRQAFGAS